MNLVTPQSLIDRLGRQYSLLLASGLILVIAVLDYRSGYAFRLADFYLVPISIVAWVAGAHAGMVAAVIASLLWLISFEGGTFYLNPSLYFWEATVMLSSFCAFVWLMAHLKRTLTHADERFLRVMEKMQAAVYVADEHNNELLYGNQRLLNLAASGAAITPRSFEAHFAPEADLAYRRPAHDPPGGLPDGPVQDSRTGRWYLLQNTPIPWGTQSGVRLKVLTDITDRKQAEILRERHGEVLHQAARMSSLAEIASSLAHEVNQPLMVITTYMDASLRLIESDKADLTELTTIMKKCQQQAVRAASIIQRLRDFIRQRHARLTACESRDFIAEVVDLNKVHIEDAHTQLDLGGVVPGIHFMADRILLIQLLDNLIRNAIEAMQDTPPSRRRLSIAFAKTDAHTLDLTVADNGQGLKDMVLEQLFSPFFTTKENGLGLGLAICRSIAEAHDGKLRGENNVSGGATFTLTLPLAGMPLAELDRP